MIRVKFNNFNKIDVKLNKIDVIFYV